MGMHITRRRLMQAAAGVAACVAPGLAAAARPIVLGHTYPATGIFATTAPDMKAALDAAVQAGNAAGGINGRELRVVSMDDGFDPRRSLANAERLRAMGAVALVAPIGTQIVDALAPWSEESRIPLIGARTGADAQRAWRRHVFFNFARFSDEVQHVAKHLDTINIRRVAIACIDNATGRDIAPRFERAAREHRLAAADPVFFDPAGKTALPSAQAVLAGRPSAVVLAGGGSGAVEVVRHLLDTGLPAHAIYGLSLQQPTQMHQLLGSRCNGMVFTLVMPPVDATRPALAGQYRDAMSKFHGGTPSLIGFEVYLSARIALHGLSKVAGEPNGSSLAAALDQLGSFDLGGFRLHYDGTSHDGTHFVDLGILNNGRVTR